MNENDTTKVCLENKNDILKVCLFYNKREWHRKGLPLRLYASFTVSRPLDIDSRASVTLYHVFWFVNVSHTVVIYLTS